MPHIDTSDFYDELKQLYSWEMVANKTLNVYDKVMNMPHLNALGRIKQAFSFGEVVGFLPWWYIIMETLVLFLCELFFPY